MLKRTWTVVAGCILLAGVATAADAPAAKQDARERPFVWGKVRRGLQVGLRSDRDEYTYGDPIRIECAIRNTGRSIHRIPLAPGTSTRGLFTDYFVVYDAQTKRPTQFSAKLATAAAPATAPTPADTGRHAGTIKVGPGQTIVLRKLDLNGIEAFRSWEQMRLRGGYPDRKVDGKRVPAKSLGTFAKSLQDGSYGLSWFVYYQPRRGFRATQLQSKFATVTIKRKYWAKMNAEERAEYLAVLKEKLLGDAWSAQKASEALGPLGKAAVPVLLEGLKHPKGPTRAWAITTLSRIEDPRAADALVETLKRDYAMTDYCAYHLWKQRTPKVLEPLAKLVATTTRASVRSWAVRGLKDFAHRLPQSVVRTLLASRFSDVQSAALGYMATRGGAGGRKLLVETLCTGANEKLRGTAAELLGQHGGKSRETYAALVKAVADDKSEFVRQMASLALAELTGNQWVYETGEGVTEAKRRDIVEKWKAWLAKQGDVK